MRVALDGRFLVPHYPGIGRYTFNLLRALPEAGPEVDFDVLLGPEDARFPHSLLCGVRPVSFAEPLRGWREQLALPRRLRHLGSDVFHAPYFVTAYRPPCPLVITLHDAIGLRSRDFLPSFKARLAFRLATYLALRAARCVITVSEASRRDLARYSGAAEERFTVIPEAAAPEFRPAGEDELETLRARLALPSRYGLFVGTAKPHKNLTGLIRAWVGLGDDALPLVVAGRREARFPEPETEARRLGANVRFLGEVAEADLPALYCGSLFFVLPSFSEGFGLGVLEAMACGTPVACARAGSLPEVAGTAAAFFDPRSTRSMVEVLSSLLREPERRRELARRGLLRSREFSWEKTAQRTLEVYRNAALSSPSTSVP